MGVFRTVLNIATKEEGDIIDLTGKVSETVKDSGLKAGIACVFVPHTTAAVFVIENESGLRSDLVGSMEKVFPKGFGYAHNTGGDGNGHSHIRASVLGSVGQRPVQRCHYLTSVPGRALCSWSWTTAEDQES